MIKRFYKFEQLPDIVKETFPKCFKHLNKDYFKINANATYYINNVIDLFIEKNLYSDNVKLAITLLILSSE